VNQSLGRKPLGALRQLFPADLRHVVTAPVYSSKTAEIDHWLVRFLAFLDTGAGDRKPGIERPASPQIPALTPIPALALDPAGPPPAAVKVPAAAPVDGGVVEFRVGGGGKLIGLNSRWRPTVEGVTARMLAPPDEAKSLPLQLVYVLAGDEDPLEFIAPYYRVSGDDPDTGSFLPASDHSLSVNLSQEASEDENGQATVSITAEVSGGAGSLRYAWGAWRVDLGPSVGFQDLGSSNSVTLLPGVYNLVLDVEDTVTGAFLRQQALVYCGARAGAPEGQ
jgi:hypothetical protein